MNTQRLTKLRISPVHLQQGLFASLALMITLIVVQQFVHWSQRSDAQVQRTYSHVMPFVKATALKASDIALKLQTVDDAATANIDEAPRQQSWVF